MNIPAAMHNIVMPRPYLNESLTKNQSVVMNIAAGPDAGGVIIPILQTIQINSAIATALTPNVGIAAIRGTIIA